MEKISFVRMVSFFMKKFIILVIVSICILCIFLNDSNDSKELRIRVIANSNSYVDQNIKMKIVRSLQKQNIDLNDLNIIKNKVEYILKENNYNSKVNVKIKKQTYEAKYYQNKIIEGGTYQTLVITLGEGNGNNYWSILYPEYYGVGFEEVNTGNVTYKIWLFEKLKKWIG